MNRIVDYASLTTQDRNPIKRRLQNLRLQHSLHSLKETKPDFEGNMLDFGAGNGELFKRLAHRFPAATMYCYEPTEGYRQQAIANTGELVNVKVIGSTQQVPVESFDYIFCLEVLEHLPDVEIDKALAEFKRMIKVEGRIIIGVPIEIHLAALLKGLFRLNRRFGEDDARFGNILKAAIGKPPMNRPVEDLESGVPYIIRHIGFDYRRLRERLQSMFVIEKEYGSPIPLLPDCINFEKYFICRK